MNYRSALVVALGLAMVSQPPARGAPAPEGEVSGPSAASLIETDYLDQFLLYQARTLRGSKPGAVVVSTAADAAGAVDGVKNGKYGFHTGADANPWWQVDLGKTEAIGRVVIYNRLDYAPGLANAYRVVVLTSEDGRTWTERYGHTGKPFGGAARSDPLVVDFGATPVRAKLVRLQLPTKEDERLFLHLDEVEVYGPADAARNLARGCAADQSSVSQWSAGKVPSGKSDEGSEWLKRMPVPGHGVGPPMDRSYINGELIKAYGLECARRGLAQAEALASRGVRLDAERARIEALSAKLAALPDGGSVGSLRGAYLELRWAIRAVVLRHPAWDVKELLFYTRVDAMTFPDVSSIHLPWRGSPGGDLQVLKVASDGRSFGEVRGLLKGRLDPGHIRGLDLHFDARRVVFGWTHSREDFSRGACRPGHSSLRKMGSGWIYELNLEDGQVRQITRGAAVHDAEPCYLLDNRVAFMSNRSRSSMQCNQGQHETFGNLYACDLDGTHLERLNNQVNGDYNPRLLADGRIGYLRWEYNERSFNNPHAFWAMRPDGTYAEPVFGQHLADPIMHTNPRSIAGSRLYMVIVSQHYNFERGIIGVLDPSYGHNDPRAIRPLMPWTKWIANTGHPTRQEQGWFANPWPLAEDLAICSYDFSRNQYQATGFGLYVVDGGGNQELLFRDPSFSAHAAVPLRPRPRPPALARASHRPPAQGPTLSPVGYRHTGGEGTCVLSDVTDGLEGLPEGVEPAWLRVSENLPLPYFTDRGQTMYSDGGSWTPKRIVGDVPLAADGSAHFKVPSDRALYFQLLDRQGREIRRMRSWVSLKDGEVRGCSGCHEGRPRAPRPQPLAAATRKPAVQPTPRVSWGDKPVGFKRDIQPIVDRHCIRCHGQASPPPKGLDLREGKGSRRLSQMTAGSGRSGGAEVSRIHQFGSAVSPLVRLLQGEKHAKEVALKPQEWIDLYAWIDLSGPLEDRCGKYEYTPDGDIAGYDPNPQPLATGLPGQPR